MEHSIYSSVAQLCSSFCDPMDYGTPGFPVLHHLLELLKLMSIDSVMPSNHLTLCFPLLFLSSIFSNIGVFSNELALPIRWPKYWSFSFSISLLLRILQWDTLCPGLTLPPHSGLERLHSLDWGQKASASFPPQCHSGWAHIASSLCCLASLKTDLMSFWSSVNNKFQPQSCPCTYLDLSATVSGRPFQGLALGNTLRAVTAHSPTATDVYSKSFLPFSVELNIACFPTTTEKWWAACPASWSTFSSHLYSKSKIHLSVLQYEPSTMQRNSKKVQQPPQAFGT